MIVRTMARRVAAMLQPALPVLLAVLAGCHLPGSIQSDVELETDRGIVRAVSTESGIFVLSDVVPPTGELAFRYRSGNGFFDDVATVVRKGDALAVMAPKSSRLNLARFAAYPAAADETLFLETREGEDLDLVECALFDAGKRGDLLVLDDDADWSVPDAARRFAGAGVFAWRDETMELVGILNGVYSEDPPALAFIGLDEMVTLLPAESSYFARRVTVRRADFEYGVPRDFGGERPSAADPPVPSDEADEEAVEEPVEEPAEPIDPPGGDR